VHLKVENSNEEAYLKIAQKCIQIAHENNVKLIVWDYPEVAKKIDADGIHFTELNNVCLKYFKNLKVESTLSCSVSSINELTDLKYEFDYLFLGPYENSDSESEKRSAIGITGYKSLIDDMLKKQLQIPVIAAGGIRLTDVAFLAPSGIYGLAISTEIFDVHDVSLEIRKFQAAIKSGWEI
jgi:thiamine-phosphate pyrophosphorylase